MFTFLTEVNSDEFAGKKLECISIIWYRSWWIGNLTSQYHQCCGDNTLLAVKLISYAWHQLCSVLSNASHIQSRHRSTLLPRFPSKRTEQRSAICNESQWNAERGKKIENVIEEKKKSNIGLDEVVREVRRIASIIRDGKINSGQNEKDWFGSKTKNKKK